MAGVSDPLGKPPARGLGPPGAFRSGPPDSAVAPSQGTRFAGGLLGLRHQVPAKPGGGPEGALPLRSGVATLACLALVAALGCVDRPAASPAVVLDPNARLLPARVRRLTNLEL